MTQKFSAFFLILFLTISGCATKQSYKRQQSDNYPAVKLLNPGNVRENKIGIALAGGGTKAASYSMGVLAAAVESKSGLSGIDAISSVSGGSYASYFLFSKLVLHDKDADNPKVSDYFADCIPIFYQPEEVSNPRGHDRLPKPYTQNMPTLCSTRPEKNASFKFQQYVRCHQDIFQNDCKPDLNAEADTNETKSFLWLFFKNNHVAPFNFIARTVFDWPVNLSMSRAAYRDGIWSTYGLYPLTIVTSEQRDDIDDICDKKHFLNCDLSSDNTKEIGFQKLRNTLESKIYEPYPTWIINATASKKRSLWGWALSGKRDFTKYTLQISPFAARSGFYGDFDLNDIEYKSGLDPLEAVTSSAAFLDANETAVGPSWGGRFLLAALQHLFAFDWGKDVDNPNVSNNWRYFHNALPIPLYYTDGIMRWFGGERGGETSSSYVRLMDGGNNDDLGAFSLVEAKMKKIIISDNANDSKGKLQDLCRFHNEVSLRLNKKLLIPGLEGFATHCLSEASESEWKGSGDNKLIDGVSRDAIDRHYSIYHWKHKVLVGCITSANDCFNSANSKDDVQIFLLKPAININEIREKYLDLKSRHHRVKSEACDKNEPGLCEVAAYIVDSYDPDDKKHYGLGTFPQDSTIFMTLNSDAKRYGAYRELGRWQMTEALKLLNDQSAFNKALAEQMKTENKIRRIQN